MRYKLIHISLFVLIIPCVVLAQPNSGSSRTQRCVNPPNVADLSQYVGKFRMNDGSVFNVEKTGEQIAMRPSLWRSVYPLHRVDGDEFGIRERADRKIEFVRDSVGCVSTVKIEGFGEDQMMPRIGSEKTPLDLLFGGHPRIAAQQMVKANPKGVEEYLNIAQMFVRNFPSKTLDGISFIEVLAKYYPKNASVHAALGDSFIQVNNRGSAVESYHRALQLDQTNKQALKALRRLKALPRSATSNQTGWTLPFPLDSVFKKPTHAEIKAVEAVWAKRNLSPKDVVEVASSKINLGYTDATVRIISHRVHGQKHYGAIVIPDGLSTKSPVILDLKGVSWNFSPLELNRVRSAGVLGEEQNKFIYVLPSFRGEILKFDGVDYVSEGDRTDSWDGATDDALALLNVALSITPQADEKRICAFGRSRGGSVALLAGIRDPKIKWVIDWTGPTDWFDLMGLEGWTQKEIVADGLLNKAAPDEDGGQVIERVLSKAIQGKQTLHDVRFQMIASSPLYFVKRLQRLQIHYGIEDEIVPIINGRALAKKMTERGRTQFESFFHANVGHELDGRIAYRESRRFLLSILAVPN